MKRYTYKRDYYGNITNLCKNITPYYVDGKPVTYYGQAIDRLSAYEDTCLTPEQIKEIDILYSQKCKELAKYKKSYEYELPCKVGDKVYANDKEFGILEYDVDCIVINESITYLCSAYLETFEDLCVIEPNVLDFGKTVFFTREEVEIALKNINDK